MDETKDRPPSPGEQHGKTVSFVPGQSDPQSEDAEPAMSETAPVGSHSADPPTIGRYRVIRLLGKGGFGRV